MENTPNYKPISKWQRFLNNLGTAASKPQNLILVAVGILVTLTTLAPVLSIILDTFKIHAGTIDAFLAGKATGWSFYNYIDLFSKEAGFATFKMYLGTPLWNTIKLAFWSCIIAILYGGGFAFLVTRTNLKFKKYLSSVFIFPYIMPQWTLSIVWQNLFNSNVSTHTSNGLFASLFGINMPTWWCIGLFPSAIVLGLHYSAFAYILIGGIFRNMDANLEEAATILNTPKWKIMFRVTLPMVKPAILSTILLVLGGAIGSYPVPHYLKYETLSTVYISMKSQRLGQGSIVAIAMMIFGILVMILNEISLHSKKNYTTVTGKSGQISKINIGKVGRYATAAVLIVLTFFTSIFPIVLFAFETFLPNPGDYSFLKSFNPSDLTLKWWLNRDLTDGAFFGNFGILFNKQIWRAFRNTILIGLACSLIAGTIGTLLGYAVSKNRRSKFASYVNSMAFLPYLMPSLAVGAAFFALISGFAPKLYNTAAILIIVGVVKYIPFASRSSLNSMLQLSPEIEESAFIQNIPWIKRMFKIIIPIQKSSIISGFLLPFITCVRELSLFMLLCGQSMILSTLLDYFDEMGLAAYSSCINLILIVTILISNWLVNKLTGASLDKGIGG